MENICSAGSARGENVFPISNHHLSADKHGLVANGGVPAFVCLLICKERTPGCSYIKTETYREPCLPEDTKQIFSIYISKASRPPPPTLEELKLAKEFLLPREIPCPYLSLFKGPITRATQRNTPCA